MCLAGIEMDIRTLLARREKEARRPVAVAPPMAVSSTPPLPPFDDCVLYSHLTVDGHAVVRIESDYAPRLYQKGDTIPLHHDRT